MSSCWEQIRKRLSVSFCLNDLEYEIFNGRNHFNFADRFFSTYPFLDTVWLQWQSMLRLHTCWIFLLEEFIGYDSCSLWVLRVGPFIVSHKFKHYAISLILLINLFILSYYSNIDDLETWRRSTQHSIPSRPHRIVLFDNRTRHPVSHGSSTKLCRTPSPGSGTESNDNHMNYSSYCCKCYF